jgi:hypothetical protein
VIVTGAGRGLGEGYACPGATVVVHDAGVAADGSGHDAVTVGSGEQDAGLGVGRPDDDPPLGTPVPGQRRRVGHQVEPQSIDEELDGGVVAPLARSTAACNTARAEGGQQWSRGLRGG